VTNTSSAVKAKTNTSAQGQGPASGHVVAELLKPFIEQVVREVVAQTQNKEQKSTEATKEGTAIGTLLVASREAAKLLGISERTLWTLTDEGDLPCVRIGRLVKYDPCDLQQWVTTHKQHGTEKEDSHG
jgi:excisionase family DNA binding protein